MDRYSKKISRKYYKKIEVGNDTSISNVVFAPYVLTFEAAQNYNEMQLDFKSSYEDAHICCPKCKSEHHISTGFFYPVNMDDTESYRDENKCTCLVCNDTHIRHDRLPRLSIRRDGIIDDIFKSG